MNIIPKGGFIDFLKKNMTVVVYNGKTYTYIPYWFETNFQTGEITSHSFDNLPDELKKGIEMEREVSHFHNYILQDFPFESNELKSHKNMTELKVGDVVQLNSGGPKMTVYSITDNDVGCNWFACERVSTAIFLAQQLTKFSS